jgi:septal ring factor EnvC (AmiA/AmiB activator)
MKISKSILVFAGLAAFGLLLSGCKDEELQGQYQQAVQQMAAQADEIKSLRAQVQVKSDSLTAVHEMVASTELRADSLNQKYRSAYNNAAGLSKELKSLQEDCSKREEELLAGIRERDSVLTVIDALFSDTNVTLTSVRGELGDERTRSVFLSDLLAKVKPWYKKWKHDATKRNFLQVLFASGKAKKPDFPEPNIDTLMMPAAKPEQIIPTDTTNNRDISL